MQKVWRLNVTGGDVGVRQDGVIERENKTKKLPHLNLKIGNLLRRRQARDGPEFTEFRIKNAKAKRDPENGLFRQDICFDQNRGRLENLGVCRGPF